MSVVHAYVGTSSACFALPWSLLEVAFYKEVIRRQKTFFWLRLDKKKR